MTYASPMGAQFDQALAHEIQALALPVHRGELLRALARQIAHRAEHRKARMQRLKLPARTHEAHARRIQVQRRGQPARLRRPSQRALPERFTAQKPSEYFPAFSTVRVDPAGRTWIRGFESVGSWTILDSTGVIMGRLDVPGAGPGSRAQLEGLEADHVVLLHADANGAVSLRFYRFSVARVKRPRADSGGQARQRRLRSCRGSRRCALEDCALDALGHRRSSCHKNALVGIESGLGKEHHSMQEQPPRSGESECSCSAGQDSELTTVKGGG